MSSVYIASILNGHCVAARVIETRPIPGVFAGVAYQPLIVRPADLADLTIAAASSSDTDAMRGKVPLTFSQ